VIIVFTHVTDFSLVPRHLALSNAPVQMEVMSRCLPLEFLFVFFSSETHSTCFNTVIFFLINIGVFFATDVSAGNLSLFSFHAIKIYVQALIKLLLMFQLLTTICNVYWLLDYVRTFTISKFITKQKILLKIFYTIAFTLLIITLLIHKFALQGYTQKQANRFYKLIFYYEERTETIY
jgi:hypothetical protein